MKKVHRSYPQEDETIAQKDPWNGRLFGSFAKIPQLFNPAFFPDLSPIGFIILYTLIGKAFESYRDTGETVVYWDWTELGLRSGVNSRIRRHIQELREAGYLTSGSKSGSYDPAPALGRIEQLACLKKEMGWTLRKLANVITVSTENGTESDSMRVEQDDTKSANKRYKNGRALSVNISEINHLPGWLLSIGTFRGRDESFKTYRDKPSENLTEKEERLNEGVCPHADEINW